MTKNFDRCSRWTCPFGTGLILLVLATGIGQAWSQSAKPLTKRAAAAQRISKQRPSPQRPLSVTTELSGGRAKVTITLKLGSPSVSKMDASVEGLKINGIQVSDFVLPRWPIFEERSKIPGLTSSANSVAGTAMAPFAEVTVVVPLGATDFRVNLVSDRKKPLKGWLLPAPQVLRDSVVPSVFEDSKYYSTSLLPILRQPMGFRGLKTIVVRIPLAEMTAPGALTARESVVVAVHYLYKGSQVGLGVSDPLFTDLYKASVANAAELPQFLARAKAPVSGTQNFDPSVTDWIDPDAPYIKLSVTRDGLYQVSSDLLRSSSGIDIQTWEAASIRCFARGREVPIYLTLDARGKVTAIDFYGRRLRGYGDEYYNLSTDTNGYWLTNSTKFRSAPLRYEQAAGSQGSFAENVLTRLHHERDYAYYLGDGGGDESATLHRSESVPGERYIWKIFRGPNGSDTSRLIDTFSVNRPNGDAMCRVFVRGISRTPNGDIFHRLSFAINGITVSEARFKNYDSVLDTFTIPVSNLLDGQNILTVNALNAGSDNDLSYLDFIEIEYSGRAAQNKDTSIAPGQWEFNANSTERRILLTASQTPVAYDLSTKQRLNVSSESGGYVVSEVRSADTVVAATSQSFLRPARIYGWNTGSRGGWNLVRRSNGADYIIIAHPKFKSVAEKLSLRRSAAGLRTMAVYTEEIYNAFDYGSGEPEALRNFLKYAYSNYAGNPVSFVTLLGDGTHDPKFNLNNVFIDPPSRTNDTSYIPTYGNPASDFYFTLVDGDDIYKSRSGMIISRIPVGTVDEAENFLRKLIQYESKPPADWNKKFLFALGGDKNEHDLFMAMAQSYLNEGTHPLRNAPLYIEPHFVERTYYGGSVDFTHVPDLQREFREGRSLVYFTGHGATFITDLYFGDPALYRNTELYPVFITLSCRTGAFAEPVDVTLNEAFLRTPDGGVVMTYGTTGYGEITYDNYMSERIFQLLGSDELRGDTVTAPHQINMTALFTAAKIYSSDLGGGFLSQNALLQYSILGDAAMGFALRPQPEFSIAASDVSVTGRVSTGSLFSLQDSSLKISARVQNFGYAPEGKVIVAFEDKVGSRSRTIFDTLYGFKNSAEVLARFPVDTTWAGTHTLRIIIDPQNEYAEENEADNEVTLQLFVSGERALQIFPSPEAQGTCSVSSDSIAFLALVPASLQSQQPSLEISASSSFSGSKFYVPISVRGGLVAWKISRSTLPTGDSIYWWRIKLVKDNGQLADYSPSSFNLNPSTKAGQSYASREQLKSTILRGLEISPDGKLDIAGLDTIRYEIVARALNHSNSSPFQVSQININENPVYSISSDSVRLAIIVLSEDGSAISDQTEFLTTPEQAGDTVHQQLLVRELDSVIRGIPDGRRVIVLTAIQPFVENFTNDTITVLPALQTLGADRGLRDIYYFDDYILFGRKGSAPGTAKEILVKPDNDNPVLSDTLLIPNRSGSALIEETDIATRFTSLSLVGDNITSESDIRLSIIAQNAKTGTRDTVVSGRASESLQYDLTAIDPLIYPRLSARLDFERTTGTSISPRLSSTFLEYEPAPELLIDSAKLTITPSVVDEGNPILATYTVENISCEPATDFRVYLLRQYVGSTDTLAQHPVTLGGFSSLILHDTISTLGLQGKVTITATIDPLRQRPEQLRFNDVASRTAEIERDTLKPTIDLRFDDRHINDGDFVSMRPRIAIKLFDDAPVRINDSSSISAVLRREDILVNPILFSGSRQPIDFTTVYTQLPSGVLQAELIITPQTPLAPGKYSLTVFGHDASGNPTDTLDVRFTVSALNGLEHVINIPNPFVSETDLTYVLRSDAGGEVQAYIYTVAGRKIRTLRSTTSHVGLNILHWDGRDEMGNDVANGTYLYRVTLRGQNPDGSSVEEGVTERAVKSR